MIYSPFCFHLVDTRSLTLMALRSISLCSGTFVLEGTHGIRFEGTRFWVLHRRREFGPFDYEWSCGQARPPVRRAGLAVTDFRRAHVKSVRNREQSTPTAAGRGSDPAFCSRRIRARAGEGYHPGVRSLLLALLSSPHVELVDEMRHPVQSSRRRVLREQTAKTRGAGPKCATAQVPDTTELLNR